jgi:hypothetical protein
LLGKRPDNVVAKQVGRTCEAVAWKRATLNIVNRFIEHPGWTEKELALLANMSDERVALKTGRTEAAIRARRWRCGSAL